MRLFKVLILSIIILFPLNLLCVDKDDLSPTSVPRIPVADYNESNMHIGDFMLLYAEVDDLEMRGINFGYNYVNYITDTAGFNIGTGLLYLNGSNSSVEGNFLNLPISAHGALRIPISPNLQSVLFAGINWSYNWMWLDTESLGIHIWGTAFGPQLGCKLNYQVNQNLEIIPFYVFNYTTYDMYWEYWYDDNYRSDALENSSVLSHIIGFDIKFGKTSIGAIIDAFKNSKDKKYIIKFSYNFGNESKDEPENNKEDIVSSNQN